MRANDGTRLHDIAIVGGGISGLGLALEASNWGFDVVLIERRALCGATSANSLRIIHGGLRYLQSFNFSRIINSIRCRHELLLESSEYVRPLTCLMPLARSGLRSRVPASAAAHMYDLLHWTLTGKRAGTAIHSCAQAEARAPLIAGLAPYGALEWKDAILVNPRAFIDSLAERSRANGALLIEQSDVQSIARQRKDFLIDCHSQLGTNQIRAKVVVNAGGPWLGQVRELLRPSQIFPEVRWCKAFNLIVSKPLVSDYALGLQTEDNDGVTRLFFITPRDGKAVIGTGYSVFDGDPSSVGITTDEQSAFVAALKKAIPSIELTLPDIDGVEVGVLPLYRQHGAALELLGSERIYDHDGYIEIISTKYTTFRSQARAALLKASRYLRET